MVYNPYSKTFLVYSPNKLDVCDLDGNVIQTFKSHITGEQQLALVDEHTICLANQMHYFDLRTGRSYRLWDKDRVSFWSDSDLQMDCKLINTIT